MRSVINILFRAMVLLVAPASFGQQPVVWQFDHLPLKGNETTLVIRADLAPGWHLYTQRLKKGGPIPTRITFEGEDDDFMPIGITEESGAASVFYDDLYGMEITWYSGEVNFSQRFSLHSADVTINGKVEYMTCNQDACIPGEEKFTIDHSP